MLVNAILTYVLINGSLFSLHSQVILTINLLASLHFLTDQELHLATVTEQEMNNTFIIIIKLLMCPKVFLSILL
jgi:hypothetical protein